LFCRHGQLNVLLLQSAVFNAVVEVHAQTYHTKLVVKMIALYNYILSKPALKCFQYCENI
jgi:hypothetical protein